MRLPWPVEHLCFESERFPGDLDRPPSLRRQKQHLADLNGLFAITFSRSFRRPTSRHSGFDSSKNHTLQALSRSGHCRHATCDRPPATCREGTAQVCNHRKRTTLHKFKGLLRRIRCFSHHPLVDQVLTRPSTTIAFVCPTNRTLPHRHQNPPTSTFCHHHHNHHHCHLELMTLDHDARLCSL